MKIIKEGLSCEEIERKRKGIRRFKCDFCGCVFEAEQGEYKCNQYYNSELSYACQCPKCDEVALEDKEKGNEGI